MVLPNKQKITKAFFLKGKKLSKLLLLLIFSNWIFFEFYPLKSLAKGNSPSEDKNNLSSRNFVSNAVQRSGPAVVTLETQRTVISRNNSRLPQGIFIDPYFDNFFRFRGIPDIPRSRIEKNQGSGVIFSPEGLVLTNAHVVEKIDQLMVGLSNGQRVPGKIIGIDTLTDLAIIRLNGTGPWPTAQLGNSDDLKVGDWAIAVGNPYGLENTVTLGIISNLNRNVSQLGISDKRLDLIQTDAAINPGNSGGPLLNANGEVIGINTLVRSGPGAGLGFAIPINRARQIAEQLISKGKASHPMIGVGLAPLIINDKDKNNANGGAIVRYVIKGGPGDQGGLKINDLIRKVGEKKIENPSDVISIINKARPGQPLKFIINRSTKVYVLYITPKDIREIRRRN